MSNQSNNNSRFNSSRDRSFYANSNTDGNTTKDTFLKNGSNIIMKDFSSFAPPSGSLVGGVGNDSVNPYVMDSKIKELESKLVTLEQANKILIERINTNEKNFALQINKMQVANAEERENRYKAEKAINIISDQNNAYSNDLNMKLNMLQEAMVKGDENKTQQRQFDLESQKYLIGKLTEKITKTVKSEVEARYKADMDGKIFSQRLSNKFESSLDTLKREMEEIANQTKLEMQNMSRECSERTHNVSKYIDQQISEAVFGKGSSNEELKNFVKKLTEQVKNSLISISKKHEVIEAKINNLESGNSQNNTDNHSFMSSVEQRLMKKINDVKLYTEINMTRHDNFLQQAMNEVTSKIEKDIKFIAGQLFDTRNKINERFEKIFEEHHDQYRKICDDMQEICNRLYTDEKLFKKYDDKFCEIEININKSLADIYSREDIRVVQERIIKTIECNFLQQQINNIYEALQRSNIQFNDDINQLNKGSNDSIQNLRNIIEEQRQNMIAMGEKNLEMIEMCKQESARIEIKQIVSEMVTYADNKITLDYIQQSKDKENVLLMEIEDNKNNIMRHLQEINMNKDDISHLKGEVKIIQNTLVKSGANMSGMEDQMKRMEEEAKELEIRESVNKVMDLMITNVESIITKEKMDKMGQFDLNKMTEKIIDLQDRVEYLSKASTEVDVMKANIQKLYEEQEYFKNRGNGAEDVKLATVQMLNNVEFENIYSILNKNNLVLGSVQNTEANDKAYNEIVDNKINKALEKMKNDDVNMWKNSVLLKDKITDPEEIKKIIQEIPPGVNQTNDSLKKLMEVGAYEEQLYTPKVNGLDNARQRSNDSNYYGNDYNYQQDPGPDIASKKSSKKSSKKGQRSNENNNQDQNNIASNANQENKSNSHKSKANSQKGSQGNKTNSNKSKANSQKDNQENKSNKSKANSKQGNQENNINNNENNNLDENQNNNESIPDDDPNVNRNKPGENEESGPGPDSQNEEGGEEGEGDEDEGEGEDQELGGQMKRVNAVSGKDPNLINK